MPIPNRTYLIERISKFQKRDEKRIYEETIKDRLDPKIFSVYKQYVPPKEDSGMTSDILEYVEADYVENNYIIRYDKFNPPGDPL
jgi:hypothetical protein